MDGTRTDHLARRQARPTANARVRKIDRIYRAHERPLYAFIYGRVGHRQAAEDITADVFVTALMHLDTTREERSIVAWLFRVARNAAADYWQRDRGVQGIPFEDAQVAATPARRADTARRAQTSARAHALLARLPANYRSVLTLRMLEGLSVAETAQRLGISTANVKVLHHRALKRAAQLQDHDDPDGGGAAARARPDWQDPALFASGRDCPKAA